MKYKNMTILNFIIFILSFFLKDNFYFVFAIAIIINIAVYIFARTQKEKASDDSITENPAIANLFDERNINLFSIYMNLWWAIFSYKICNGNILYFALLFILFDVLFTLINKIDAFFAAKYIIRQGLVSDFESIRFPTYQELYDEAYVIIGKQEIKEQKKKEQEEKVLTSLRDNNKDKFEKIVKKLKSYPYDTNPVPDEKFEQIIDKIDFLTEQVKLQEKLIDTINISRLEIYTDELILFLNSCIKIDLDENENYMDKMQKVLETYERYLDGLLQTIEGQLKMEIDVNYKVLTNLLEREK